MADNDHEERFRQHEEILRSLTAMLVKMDGYLARQEAVNEELKGFNARQVEINEDVKTTLARLETLVSRMMQQGENGRDA